LITGLCAWSFVATAAALERRRGLVNRDQRLANWVEGHNTEWGEKIVSGFTLFGDQLLWVIVAAVAVWLIWKRAFRELGLLLVGAAGSYLFNTLLKAEFNRPRPVFAAEFHVDKSSFPSGHAMNSVVVYGLLAYIIGMHVRDPRHHAWLIVGASIIAIGLGLTRIYLDVHYLSDVMAGFAAGGVWLGVCITGFAFARRFHMGE
jgi:undecaprenyl-diphosphatase